MRWLVSVLLVAVAILAVQLARQGGGEASLEAQAQANGTATPADVAAQAEIVRLQQQLARLEAELAQASRMPAAAPPRRPPATDPTNDASNPPDTLQSTEQALRRLVDSFREGSEAERWLKLANYYIFQEEYGEGGRAILEAVLADPEVEGWYDLISYLAYADQQLLLESLVEIFPERGQLWVDLGAAYLARVDERIGERLQVVMAEAASEDTDEDELLEALYEELYDELSAEAGERAAACYLKALQLEPTNGSWAYALAEANPQLALSVLEDLAYRHPDELELWEALATACYGADRQEQAIDVLEHICRLDPTNWWSELVDAAPQRAVAALEIAAAGSEEMCRWTILGEAYMRVGDKQGATRAFLQALSLDAAALESVVQYYDQLDSTVLLPALESAVRQSNNDELWGTLAKTYRGLGREPEFREALRQALTLDPTDSEWLGMLTEVDPGEALSMLSELVANDDGNDETWGDLGDTYRLLGRLAEARQCYERAASLDPTDEEWSDALVALDRLQAEAEAPGTIEASPRDP